MDNRKVIIEKTLAKARTSTSNWRFRPTDLSPALAAAGLLRSANLLAEALALTAGPSSTGANVLVRSAFECWQTGAWLLFGGETAILRLELTRVIEEEKLARLNQIVEVSDSVTAQTRAIQELAEGRTDIKKLRPVTHASIAEELGHLVAENTGDQEASATNVYNLMYRSHSTFDAHPWKILSQMLDPVEDGFQIRPAPLWIDPLKSIASMSLCISLLGYWISRQADEADSTQWEALFNELREAIATAT